MNKGDACELLLKISNLEAENAQLKAELEKGKADFAWMEEVLQGETEELKAELAEARYMQENAESALNTHMEIHTRVVNELQAAQHERRGSLEQPHTLRSVPATTSSGTPFEVAKKEAGT